MGPFIRKASAAGAVIVSLFCLNGSAQSLTDKLSEKESFYKNYGNNTYSKMTIQQDVIGLYDMFGEHITDGVFMYDLHDSSVTLTNEREGVIDSTLYSKSVEFQKNDLFEKFSNLVVTQDAIGGTKTAFMVGDQITTRFTPLTFNKVNYRGIRFDLWSTGLQLTGLLSRTRPGFLSKKGTSGDATVAYPLDASVFNDQYYGNVSNRVGGFYSTQDYSSKSPFGDYDWLISAHAQNNIANKVDVGLTYINHHSTNVKKGEKWIEGDLPSGALGWMPSEIHFEIYDLTPYNDDDAGAYAHDFKMFVNNQEVAARPQFRGTFRKVYIAFRDSILLPRDLPIAKPQSGRFPIIVAFKTDPQYWYFAQSGRTISALSGIKSIRFEYTLAGNYLVFVSTSKQIYPSISGIQDQNTKLVKYSPVEKQVSDLFEGTGQPVKVGTSYLDADYANYKNFSTTYFGEYVAKSPHLITPERATRTSFESICNEANRSASLIANPNRESDYNFRTYTYNFGVNASSITYGADFSGELAGIKFAGEVALNQRENQIPASDSVNVENRWVGTLKADKEIGRQWGVSTDVYYISPDWQTNMVNLQASRYFKETSIRSGRAYADYLSYPYPHGNGWQNVDDNDDNDAFVESDRRHYPSDLSNDDQAKFYADGTLQWPNVKSVLLPSDMWIAYDDPDGVVASKDDRNRNGVPDYQEDFLLFASDPPVFEMGNDLNNNGLPDYEDDDILPDFGHSVGSFVTSNGIKTLGIKGIGLNFRWTPRNWICDFGGRAEGILDYDMDGITDGLISDEFLTPAFYDDKSFVVYATTKREIIKRSQGIQYDIGNELRVIRDAIANDAIQSTGINNNGAYNVSYRYYIDPLNFRRSAVDNLIGNLIYNNIRNFEYAVRAKLGAQKHLLLDQLYYKKYSFDDPVAKKTIFVERWEPYDDRTIGEAYLVNRISYKIGFKNEYEDWRRYFNFLNRLEIIPQYKISYSMTQEIQGPGTGDPRTIEKLEENYRMDINHDGKIDSTFDNVGDNLERYTQARIDQKQYRDNNKSLLLNVPILRVNYKIAENTQFQLGVQGLRKLDFISAEQNGFNLTTLAQVVSKASYRGYNVTFFLGAKWQNNDYDVNAYDPVLDIGSRYDRKKWEFFAQLYSGQ